MKKFVPAAVAVAILAGIGLWFWLAGGHVSIPTAFPSAAPAVGTCWNTPEPGGTAIPCDQAHKMEIYYRGQADRKLLIAYQGSNRQDSQAAAVLMQAEARTGCTGNAAAYLGGSWRSAQLTLLPSFLAPEKNGFYVCGAAQTATPTGADLIARTGSLRGVLSGPEAKALVIDCYEDDGAWASAVFRSCAKNHDGEYVGDYTVTPLGAPFNGPELAKIIPAGCQSVLDRFLGLPDGAPTRPDVQVNFVGPTTADNWVGSDQTYACYAGLGKDVRGSIKGLGTRPLPH